MVGVLIFGICIGFIVGIIVMGIIEIESDLRLIKKLRDKLDG